MNWTPLKPSGRMKPGKKHIRTCEECGETFISEFRYTSKCDSHKKRRGMLKGTTWKWHKKRTGGIKHGN